MRLVREKKYHTLILPRVWLKTKITQIHALAKTRNHCFDQYILYHQHSYTNSALLQRRILVLGKHAGSKNDECLVWKQLCARNKVFNRLEALHRKPSLSIVFNISSKTKKYICTLKKLTGKNQATWLTYRERWFKWVTAIRINLIISEFANLWLHRCAKRGSSLPLGTPMEIDFTSAYLHYPLPQCSKIVTPIIFSISYELFRLPSAKVPQDYQLLRTFVWCLMECWPGRMDYFLIRNDLIFLE